MTVLHGLDSTTGPHPGRGAGRRVRTTFPPVLDRAARRRLSVQVRALVSLPPLPHVAPVLDGGVDSAGRAWIDRPGPAGPTLADRRAGGPLAVPEAFDLIVPALSGLAALHALGVVHGGVGPEAVVVDEGRPVLVDPRPPMVAERAGPPDPALAAAEVLRGETPGPPADVAAAAATLVYLVTGQAPWGPTGDEAETVLLRLLSGAPPALGPLAGWPAAAAAVTRALAVVPAERPTAASLAATLAGAPDSGSDRIDTREPAAPLPGARAAPHPDGTPVGSRYLLHERLGRGAMGEVYRATARDGGPDMAVKVLRAELSEDATLVNRFLAERATLTGIEHPNLVRVHDLVAEGATLAIVMDLVDGPDLRRYLRTAPPLPPAAACRLLAQLAGALAAVHQAGVVHRDLKPENVLLERTGSEDVRVRLADFGVARSSSRAALTRADQLIGTPEYLAPELAAGATAGPGADVYALGVVAYELLAGRRPFEGEHPAALLKAHAESAPARPPGIDDRLWAAVAGCLAKDPRERPSAPDLAAAIAERAAALHGAPPLPRLGPAPAGEDEPPVAAGDRVGTVPGTLPPPPRPAPEAPPGARRARLLGAVVAAVLAGGLAGVVAVVAGRGDGGPGASTTTTAVPAAVRTVPLVTQGERADARSVNLRFEPVEGAEDYVVVRDPANGDVVLDVKPLAGAAFVAVVDEDNDKEHCYVVMAVIRDDAPGPPTSAAPVLRPYCTR